MACLQVCVKLKTELIENQRKRYNIKILFLIFIKEETGSYFKQVIRLGVTFYLFCKKFVFTRCHKITIWWHWIFSKKQCKFI